MATFEGHYATITADDVTVTDARWAVSEQDMADFVTAWNANLTNQFSVSWVGDDGGYLGDFYYYPGMRENGWQGGNYPFAGPLAAYKESANSPWVVSLGGQTGTDEVTIYTSVDDLSVAGDWDGFGSSEQPLEIHADVLANFNAFTAQVDVTLTLALTVQDPPIPVFTVTDDTSGNSIQDSDDIVASPTSILGVVQHDGTSVLTLDLTNMLAGKTYTYTIGDGAGHTVNSGTFDPLDVLGSGTGATAIVFPATGPGGFYTINVKMAEDPSFDRTIQYYVGRLDILWNGANVTDGTGAVVVTTGQNISHSTMDYFAGQHISLACSLTAPGATLEQRQWDVGGGGIGLIKEYQASTSSGTMIALTADDLHAEAVSCYSLADLPNHTFKVTALIRVGGALITLSNTTTINIKKPGQSIWAGQFRLVGNVDSPWMDANELHGHADWHANSLPAGTAGAVHFVQLISATASYSNFLGWHTVYTTNGGTWLDNNYPYDHPSMAGTGGDADDPWVSGYFATQLHLALHCQVWMTWTPPGGDSIPVPIQTMTWDTSADATWNAATSSWSLVGTPAAAHTAIAGVDTNVLPEWTNRLVTP